jgi:uncharacterized protein (TIGR01244 family)
MFRKIDDLTFVAPQIAVADVAAAQAQGITLIINNRPDGEEPDAPQGAEIDAAARAVGISYVAIPVTHAGFSQPQVDAMVAALDTADGPVLAYCRSGTRSTLLWALASTKMGEGKAALQAKAAAAGYDLSPVEPLIDMLAAQG